MPDREKVINAYEDFVNGYECFCTSDDYEYEMHKAVLALLKEDCHNCKLKCLLQKYDELKEKYDALLNEQEAVEPEVEVLNEIDKLYRCPKCHKHFFYEKQKYCDQCGQVVKWNE